MKRQYLAVIAMSGLILGLVGGCPTIPPTEVDQFEVVRSALAAYFGADPAPPGAKKAVDVQAAITDENENNRPYVLSVRGATDYAAGHVPGAANIPWREVAKEGALAAVPTDREVVVYCYTGHTAGVATCILNALGYDAVNMKFGFVGWTQNEDLWGAPRPFSEETDAHQYDVETIDNPGTANNALPTLDVTTSTETAEIVRAASDAYLSAGTPPTISAADLNALITDDDATNDPFIISVRKADDYAKGHIPGAINIPWLTIAELDNLKKIPADQDIVVYCYTGHTGGLATTALNMLGYNAKNLKFGIMSWTDDVTVRAQAPFTPGTDDHDYPVEP